MGRGLILSPRVMNGTQSEPVRWDPTYTWLCCTCASQPVLVPPGWVLSIPCRSFWIPVQGRLVRQGVPAQVLAPEQISLSAQRVREGIRLPQLGPGPQGATLTTLGGFHGDCCARLLRGLCHSRRDRIMCVSSRRGLILPWDAWGGMEVRWAGLGARRELGR